MFCRGRFLFSPRPERRGIFYDMMGKKGTMVTNPKGRFGSYGGQYIPESLMNAVMELEEA